MDLLRLQCKIPAGDSGRYELYERQVRGYHFDEFAAAITDSGILLEALQREGGFADEIRWLQRVIEELRATQNSMLHGLVAAKTPSPRVSAGVRDSEH